MVQSSENLDIARNLDPSHPLLEQFQKDLKKFLLAQIESTKFEITCVENQTRQKAAEIEKVTLEVYEEQQIVAGKQHVLKEVIKSIEDCNIATQKEDKELKENTRVAKELEEKLLEREKQNEELKNEVGSVKLLNFHFSEHEIHVEENLTINIALANKKERDNKKLCTEKRKQDFLIYSISKDVWKLESEVESTKLTIQIKENELKDLENKIVSLNTTIDGLRTEHNTISTSWQHVCNDIILRDSNSDQLSDKFKTIYEKNQIITSEIGKGRLLLKKEMKNNKSLEAHKKRIQEKVNSSKRELQQRLEEKNKLEKGILETEAVIKEMAEEVAHIKDICRHKKYSIQSIHNEYKVKAGQKEGLENDINQIMTDQELWKQSNKNLKAKLLDMLHKRKELQLKLLDGENKKNTIDSALVKQRDHNQKLEAQLQQENLQIIELTNIRKILKISLWKYEAKVLQKEKFYQNLENKISNYDNKVKSNEGVVLSGISTLEKTLEDMKDGIKHLQKSWITEQRNIFSLLSKRQQQIVQVNKMRQQKLIEEEKISKSHLELKELKKLESTTNRKIEELHFKLKKYSKNCLKQKNIKNDLTEDKSYLKSNCIVQLKDEEMSLLQLESEVANMESEKLELSKLLVDTNKEFLEWEKRYMSVKNVLQSYQNLSRKEMNDKRSEINRLKELYHLLQRTQAKLKDDISSCLSAARSNYESYISNCVGGDPKKLDHTRIISDAKNKIKQNRNDILQLRNEITNRNSEIQTTQNLITQCQNTIQFQNTYLEDCQNELEEAKLNTDFKYQLTHLLRKKMIFFRQIIIHGKLGVCFNGDEINERAIKEKNIYRSLKTVVANLMEKKPEKKGYFYKMSNSLAVVILGCNS